MLLLVEVLYAVASVVVVAERFLLFLFVELGGFIPKPTSDLVDCHQYKSVAAKTPAQPERTFVDGVAGGIQVKGCGGGGSRDGCSDRHGGRQRQ